MTFTEQQVAAYLARCPTWQGCIVCSVRRTCRVTGLCRGEVERALARLMALVAQDIQAAE